MRVVYYTSFDREDGFPGTLEKIDNDIQAIQDSKSGNKIGDLRFIIRRHEIWGI